MHFHAAEAHMPGDKKEPQSYGSTSDWVTGKTGQAVNDQKSAPPAEHRDFYDERREAETSASDQGGKTSPLQLAENAQLAESSTGAEGESSPVTKVTTQDGGAKRDSYFRQRDYE
jgi:hypothetical protein